MVSLAVNTDWKNRFSKFVLSSGSSNYSGIMNPQNRQSIENELIFCERKMFG